MLQIGIIGLPNAGKSTLFNALTHAHADVAARPFTTIQPNEAIVHVPDDRLERVAEMFGQERRVPVTIAFVDIAGLVRGAHRGEGLGNQFLAHIREVDAILHVVRCFDDPTVPHVDGTIDPLRDIDTIETELAFADLTTVERRMERDKKGARLRDKEAEDELALLERLHAHLNAGRPARTFAFADDERQTASALFLLTAKPLLYLANVDESDDPRTRQLIDAIRTLAESRDGQFLRVPAKLASEIAELQDDEAASFARELGLEEGVLAQVIRTSYALLDVVTFYTAVGAEASAWVVRRNTHASAAAGKIHTDIERGFIRADVIAFDDLMRAGSWHAARDAALIDIRGRDYLVRDGDVIHVHFQPAKK